MQPYGSRLIVKRLESESESKSGFYITEAHREIPSIATVMAIGEEIKNIKTGNKVIFPKSSGYEVEINGDKLLIINDYDILAYEV